MEKLKCLVVGLGQIGMGYDYSENSSVITTHAKAFELDDRFELVGGVDLDSSKRAEFEEKFKKSAYTTIEAAFKEKKYFDVISIATPTEYHLSDIEKAVSCNPKLILCEKPLSNKYEEAQKIVQLCQQKNIVLVVNFKRRFDPGFIQLKEQIENGAFGKLCFGNAVYSKGIMNNGSHFIDLLSYYFKEVFPGKTTKIEQSLGYNIQDQDADFSVLVDQVDVQFKCLDKKYAGIAELDLFFEKARITIDHGLAQINVKPVTDNDKISGLKSIGSGREIKTEMLQYQKNVCSNIYSVIKEGKKPYCSGFDGLKSIEIIAKTIQG